MAWSLANSSPYKQWNFQADGTVRCVNCHGDPRKLTYGTPPLPQLPGVDATTGAGADLAPHSSEFRGLLIQNYRDRLLKPKSGTDSGYAAVDFALCYLCHAEEPFRSGTDEMTAFDEHARHVSVAEGKGPRRNRHRCAGAGRGQCSLRGVPLPHPRDRAGVQPRRPQQRATRQLRPERHAVQRRFSRSRRHRPAAPAPWCATVSRTTVAAITPIRHHPDAGRRPRLRSAR